MISKYHAKYFAYEFMLKGCDIKQVSFFMPILLYLLIRFSRKDMNASTFYVGLFQER